MTTIRSLALILSLFAFSNVGLADDNTEALLEAVSGPTKCVKAKVDELVGKADLNEDVVLAALKSGCQDIFSGEKFKTWAKSDGNKHTVLVSKKYGDYLATDIFPRLQKRVDSGGYIADDVDSNAIGFGLQFAKALGKKPCADSRNSSVCQGIVDPEKLEKQFMALVVQSDKNQKKAGSDSMLDEACPMLDEKHYYESVIAKENEAAKISGVIDKQKLYEAGKVITHHNEALKPLVAGYKRKTGQDLTLKKCPAKYQQ